MKLQVRSLYECDVPIEYVDGQQEELFDVEKVTKKRRRGIVANTNTNAKTIGNINKIPRLLFN